MRLTLFLRNRLSSASTWIAIALIVPVIAVPFAYQWLDKKCSLGDLAEKNRNSEVAEESEMPRRNHQDLSSNRQQVTLGSFSTVNVFETTPRPETPQSKLGGVKTKYEWAHSFICEAKLSEFLVALFTYFLFVVTLGLVWMGRNQEKMSRIHERAYATGKPKIVLKPEIGVLGRGALINSKKGAEYRLFVENAGRTPAIIKKVSWCVVPLDKLPTVPVYAEWTNSIQTLHPDQAPTATKAPVLLYRFDWGNDVHVVYGKIVYEDVFREMHSSGFLYRIQSDGNNGFQHLSEPVPEYWEWT